jgi:hypothetical protein
MARGQQTPPAIQWIVIRLATIMNRESVAAYAGISLRSVERILAHFNKTQTIKMAPEHGEVVARRYLRDYDTRVRVLVLIRPFPTNYIACRFFLQW